MIPLQALYEAADRHEAAAVRALLPALDPRQRVIALEMGAPWLPAPVPAPTSAPIWMRFCRSLVSPIRKALRSCVWPRRCCESRMTQRPIG